MTEPESPKPDALQVISYLIAAAILLVPGIAVASPTYFCTARLSTGFKPADGQWRQVNFRTENNQYLITSAGGDPETFEVKEMGKEVPAHTNCSKVKFGDFVSSRIACGGLGVGFLFDTKTLRFSEIYNIGYLENDQSGNNTPALTVGECTVLSN